MENIFICLSIFIAEVLWIKDLRPMMNKQKKSIQLKLFNYYDDRELHWTF